MWWSDWITCRTFFHQTEQMFEEVAGLFTFVEGFSFRKHSVWWWKSITERSAVKTLKRLRQLLICWFNECPDECSVHIRVSFGHIPFRRWIHTCSPLRWSTSFTFVIGMASVIKFCMQMQVIGCAAVYSLGFQINHKRSRMPKHARRLNDAIKKWACSKILCQLLNELKHEGDIPHKSVNFLWLLKLTIEVSWNKSTVMLLLPFASPNAFSLKMRRRF